MTNSATSFLGKSTSNVRRTFKTVIWCGWLNIWTRYVAALPLPALCFSQRRFSIVLILAVPLSRSVCTNSAAYAALGEFSRDRTRFRLQLWILDPGLPPRGVLVICTKGSSTVPGFASNAFGCTPRGVQRRPQKCVISLFSLSASDEARRRSIRRL